MTSNSSEWPTHEVFRRLALDQIQDQHRLFISNTFQEIELVARQGLLETDVAHELSQGHVEAIVEFFSDLGFIAYGRGSNALIVSWRTPPKKTSEEAHQLSRIHAALLRIASEMPEKASDYGSLGSGPRSPLY